MIIIGHKMIKSEEFHRIYHIEDIGKTNHLVWFEEIIEVGLKIARFCQDNEVEYAVKINSITELVLYGALGAKYVIIDGDVIEYQKVANEYLLDTKILALINRVDEIEKIARLGIDGVIFQEVL